MAYLKLSIPIPIQHTPLQKGCEKVAVKSPKRCGTIAIKSQKRCEKVAVKFPKRCEKVAVKSPKRCGRIAYNISETLQKYFMHCCTGADIGRFLRHLRNITRNVNSVAPQRNCNLSATFLQRSVLNGLWCFNTCIRLFGLQNCVNFKGSFDIVIKIIWKAFINTVVPG